MGTQKQRGFTIIELILVLGITALLTVSLMVGTGITINSQRYTDAVQTLRNTLQTQYSELGSVRNARTNDWSCNTATAETSNGGAVVNRGQSECVMMGRLVTIVGGDITTYSVIGTKISEPELYATDMDILTTNYHLDVADSMTQSSQMEWGSRIAWATTGLDAGPAAATRAISILYIISPNSGQIYTFTQDGAIIPSYGTLKNMLVSDEVVPGRKARVICVDSGGLTTVPPLAIYIGPKAAASSAIESRDASLLVGSEC